ncbi:MAG: tRNA glutamyl-Q(34) synthetase GluQRS [Pseudomonadota bacterium]
MCSAVVERFAPSPTGLLHLGHAFSALTAFDAAREGRFLLRMEDIDTARSRPQFEAAIYDDLRWLGLTWETPVWRQSQRLSHYAAAVDRLTDLGLTYRCVCTRADIKAALSAPQEGVAFGPDGPVYPGTCRDAGHNAAGAAIRLNMRKALQHIEGEMFYEEIGGATPMADCTPEALISQIGDVVLARRDIGTAYHVAVVVDDAAQGITHVTRGADLAPATPIHVLLQRLLGLPTPIYRHHRLIRDETGKRLAKRDDARAIRAYLEAGETPESVRAMLGLTPSGA